MLNSHALTSLPLSTRDLVRFTPPDREGQDDAPVYLLAVPTYRDVIKWRHAVRAEGAQYPGDGEMLSCLRAAVTALVSADEQGSWFETLDQYEAATEKTDDLNKELNGIADSLKAYWPEISQLIAARGFYLELAPLIAAQMFLRGWENVAPKFERRGGLVPEALLDKIGRSDAALIGFRAIALMEPTETQSKNSASPSRSASSPPAIAAVPTQPTAAPDGASAENSTNGTLGSN
jgi:hypothetical protein